MLRAERLPWLMFLFLAVVFFLMTYNLIFAEMGGSNDSISVNDLTAAITEGSLTRQIALISLALVAIASLLHHRSNVRLRVNGLLGWVFLGFMVWAFLSSIWAADVALTLKRLVILGILCVAAVAIVLRFSLRMIILWTVFTTTIFLLIGVFAELAFGTFTPFTSGYRFAGAMHPNVQGVDCALLLLSAVAAADIEKCQKLLFRGGALLGFVFLILTGSRTSFASVLLAQIGRASCRERV